MIKNNYNYINHLIVEKRKKEKKERNFHTMFLPCINFNSKPLFVCQKIKGFHFPLIKNK